MLTLLALAVDLVCLPLVVEMAGFDRSLIWSGSGGLLARHLSSSLFEQLGAAIVSEETE